MELVMLTKLVIVMQASIITPLRVNVNSLVMACPAPVVPHQISLLARIVLVVPATTALATAGQDFLVATARPNQVLLTSTPILVLM